VADGQHSEAIGAAARQRRVRGVRNIQNKQEYSFSSINIYQPK